MVILRENVLTVEKITSVWHWLIFLVLEAVVVFGNDALFSEREYEFNLFYSNFILANWLRVEERGCDGEEFKKHDGCRFVGRQIC